MFGLILAAVLQVPPAPRVPPEAWTLESEGPRALPKLELDDYPEFREPPKWEPQLPVFLDWGYFRYRRFWVPLDVRDIPTQPPAPVHPPVR